MDVTCDRCSTRYEFDEALVSSRGTTVKCTNCGHQFKVYRPQGATQLDGWTIRTTDGRELKYDAMRKLQAAISNGAVHREDVLIPNDGGEPRRLGKIEELQSFFRGDGEDELTQRRSGAPMVSTAPGHRTSSYPPRSGEPPHAPHPTEMRVDAASPSMMITRVAGGKTSQPHLRDRDGEAVPSRTGKTLRPPGSPSGRPRAQMRSEDPPTLARAPIDDPTRHRGQPDPFSGLEEEGTRARDHRSNGRSNGGPPSSGPLDVDAIAESVKSSPAHILDGGFDEATNPRLGRVSRPSQRDVTPPRDVPLASDDDTLGDQVSSDASVVEALAKAPAGPPAVVPVARRADDSEYPLDDPHHHPHRDDAMSLAPLTPSPSAARPSILRRSVPYTDPRFSMVDGRGKSPGLARFVVGIIALGVLGIGGYALVQRYAPAPAQSSAAPAEDGRVDAFLKEGEQRLFEGDVEAAKDQFIKASAVSQNDPRVSRALARIEVIRADLLWLHIRLFAEDDPHRKALEAQLASALERARTAAKAAIEHAADDPVSVGLKIDLLRFEGKHDEARPLVGKLDGAGPDGGRALALLDLLEKEPSYGSVIDRLRSAARAERKLARSQALLVYALVRAGRKEEADKELATLQAQNPAHPLLEPLRAFVEGVKQPEPVASASATVAVKSGQPPVYTGRPEPETAEPFATAEPDHPIGETTTDAPPPPPPSDQPPPPPPAIDTSDLPDNPE